MGLITLVAILIPGGGLAVLGGPADGRLEYQPLVSLGGAVAGHERLVQQAADLERLVVEHGGLADLCDPRERRG